MGVSPVIVASDSGTDVRREHDVHDMQDADVDDGQKGLVCVQDQGDVHAAPADPTCEDLLLPEQEPREAEQDGAPEDAEVLELFLDREAAERRRVRPQPDQIQQQVAGPFAGRSRVIIIGICQRACHQVRPGAPRGVRCILRRVVVRA